MTTAKTTPSLSKTPETKRSPRPFIIGVTGGSGSGKSTVVENLTKVMKRHSVVCISYDDYYRDQSQMSMAERQKINYDHPSSLETELLVAQLRQLIAGETVQKPTYDFVQNTRAKKTITLKPAKVIIVEGILLFESKELRELLDLKVFVDTDPDMRVVRRIQRDMSLRGRTLEYVIDQYITFTRPMHMEFVEPNKRHADIIIPEGGFNTVALDLLLARVKEIVKKK